MEKHVFNEKEAAFYLGVSVTFLQHDRSNGIIVGKVPGPDYLKIGGRIRYLKEDLDSWLKMFKVNRAS